jgi:O-antigen/teichoic acid export membrane protein
VSQEVSSSLRTRILKGLGANAFGQIIHVVNRLLLPPFFLRAWGAEIYGEWMVLASIALYFQVFDLGGRFYINNRLTQVFAEKDVDGFRRILHSGLAVYLALPLFLFTVFIASAEIVGVDAFMPLRAVSGGDAIAVLAILAITPIGTIPQSILFGVLRATGRFHRAIMYLNTIEALQTVGVFLGLVLGLKVVDIAWIQVIPFLLVTCAALLFVHRSFPEFYVLRWVRLDWREIRSFFRPSLHFFWIHLAAMLPVHGLVYLVGVLLDPTSVALFITCRALSNVITQATGMFAMTAWPEFTRLEKVGDVLRLRKLATFAFRSTAVLTLAAFAVFQLWGDSVYRIWLGGHIAYDPLLMGLLLLYVIQSALWFMPKTILMSVNAQECLSKSVMTSSVIMLPLAFAGGMAFGLHGVVGAMIVSELALPFWRVPQLLSSSVPELSLRWYWLEVIPVIMAAALIAAVPVVSPVVMFAVVLLWWRSVRIRRQSGVQ